MKDRLNLLLQSEGDAAASASSPALAEPEADDAPQADTDAMEEDVQEGSAETPVAAESSDTTANSDLTETAQEAGLKVRGRMLGSYTFLHMRGGMWRPNRDKEPPTAD